MDSITADALALYVARASSAMIVTTQNEQILNQHEEEFHKSQISAQS